ncbi:hypothetical protein MPSEU_000164100 [Mayamaea pseudoterrestris]|nr:hypothetical protein MPSEU_000164100 [Mayamaea pseudoterrestris]
MDCPSKGEGDELLSETTHLPAKRFRDGAAVALAAKSETIQETTINNEFVAQQDDIISHGEMSKKSDSSAKDAAESLQREKEEEAPDYSPIVPKKEEARTRVAAFDLEETLVNWSSSIRFPSELSHYELWNVNVIDKLRSLHDEGNKLLIVSNQGGIKKSFDGKIANKIKHVIEWMSYAVDRPIHFVASTNAKSGLHKPASGLWKIAEQLCNKEVSFDLENSIFIGDSIDIPNDSKSGVDSGFARAVGVKFLTPEEMFGPSSLRMRAQSSHVEYEVPPKQALETCAAFHGGYLDDDPILLILCGVQGSGKSFFCSKLTTCNDSQQPPSREWIHLSQDTICDGRPGRRQMVEAAALSALREGKSVIIDRMHLTPDQRKYFVDVGMAAGASIHAVVLNPPMDVVAARIRSRTDHPSGFQGEGFVKWGLKNIDQLTIPTYAEGFSLIQVTRNDHGVARIAEKYRALDAMDDSIAIPKFFALGADVTLPSIALGTFRMGKRTASDIVSKAIQLGIRAVDTAPTYDNEEQVGTGLMTNDNTFCIVKVPKRADTADKVRVELTKSLKALQRQRADLLLLHWPSDVDTMQAVWQEMEACHEEGLTRAIGVCNFGIQSLLQLLHFCKTPPVVNQVERHVLLPQWDLVEFCNRQDILLQAHTPLGQGTDTVLAHPIVTQVAATSKLSPAAVLLKWNLQQGVPVVPKGSTNAHLTDIPSTLEPPALSYQALKALNAISDSRRFIPIF